MELHDDLEVGGGRAVDGVQVDRRVVRLLDLLRALLVEDLAQGAGVPGVGEISSMTNFVALGHELWSQLASTKLHKQLVEELTWHA